MSNTITAVEPSGRKPKKWITSERVIVYSVLTVCALFFLFPLYIMIITSMKDIQAIQGGNIFIPTMHPTFTAWEKAWNSACTGLYCEGIKVGFWNSVRITGPSVIVSIAVASLTGYSLANWPFKFSEAFFTVLLVSSFIPYVVMLYPLVIITRWLGIYSTLPGGSHGYMSGTSQATAFATGVAALLIANDPRLRDPRALIQHLVRWSAPRAALNGKLRSGGLLDARLALEGSDYEMDRSERISEAKAN